MTCEDCIHYDACADTDNLFSKTVERDCINFKERYNMAKWVVIEEDELIDGWAHHKCSSCGSLALFSYKYSEDFDEGMDGEWFSRGYIESGICEHITRYCPNCGAEMDCSDAIHRINGCKACVHYDEASCNYGYTEECISCGDYPWASDELQSKWEIKNKTSI